MAPVTVVTGGGRGIGAATVRQLAAAGHDVAFCYRSDAEAAATVLRDVHAAGRRASRYAPTPPTPTRSATCSTRPENWGN